MKTCTVPQCPTVVVAKGLCTKHYYRQLRHGTTEVFKPIRCGAPECEKTFTKVRTDGKIHGYCATHRMRMQRRGTLSLEHDKRKFDGKTQERNRARTKKWKEDNKEYYLTTVKARKSRVRRATPSWVKLGDLVEVYKNCPEGFEVDHVVPINGKTVCGLHVPWNLQYLSPLNNMRKGSKTSTHGVNRIPGFQLDRWDPSKR